MDVDGVININGKEYVGSKVHAIYESGRGVWPARSGWFRVSANGKMESGIKSFNIGLNIGHGFNNHEASRFTEDCFFINGKVFKLESVESKKYSFIDKNYDWIFSSKVSEKNKNYCVIKFKLAKIVEKNSNLIITSSNSIISYGMFEGECHDSDDKVYVIRNLYGIIEEKSSLW
jgi:hypothetical protein